MDGFDDLLSPTARALHENPFEDPFARPRSPDPWATFSQQPEGVPQAEDNDHVHRSQGYNDALHHIEQSNSSLESFQSLNTLEEPSSSSHTLQSPGFRESISVDGTAQHDDISETISVQSTKGGLKSNSLSPKTSVSSTPPRESSAQEPYLDSTISSRPTSPRYPISQGETLPGPPPFFIDEAPPPRVPPFMSSPPASSKTERVVSPLERPSGTKVDRPFASLAIGGESIGGWQDSSQSVFINDPPTLNNLSNESSPPANDTQTPQPTEGSQASIPSLSSQKPDPSIRSMFAIKVDDPQKVGDPIRPFIMYTVHTKTSSPLFSKTSFSVLRRYSDFLWLYETLSMNNPGVFVPPVPEKSSFGRFESQFVQQRRLALEKCVQKIANHPVLAKDPDLKLFLDSDSFALDIKHRKAEIAHERGGLMSSIGQTIVGSKFYEMDEWFDVKRSYLDSLESQLKGLVKAIDIVSKQRAELAVATGEFAHTVGELSGSELSKQLSHSLVVMSDVEKRARDLQDLQAQEDVVTFMSTAEEYSRIINSVRLAFTARIRCYNIWQSAENEVRRVKQAHEKARGQGRIPQDRLSHSLSQIADVERKAIDAKQEFSRASSLIKSEMVRFEEERIQDFKESLESFLEGMISRQKELIDSWESYQELLLKKVNAVQRPLNQTLTQSPSAHFLT